MIMNRLVLGLAAVPLLIGGMGFTLPGSAAVSSSTLTAQNSTQLKRQGTHHHSDFAKTLGLTDIQKAQLKMLRESTHQQMTSVFTPAQKEQLRLARLQQQHPNLNLSEAQKAQIKAIHQNAKSKMDAVLTAQQRQQLQSLRQQHRHQQQQ
jgi:protein CpxP